LQGLPNVVFAFVPNQASLATDVLMPNGMLPPGATAAAPVLYLVCEDIASTVMVHTPLFVPGLRALDLAGLGVGDECCGLMAGVLQQSSELQLLDLGDSGITDAGVAALCGGLAGNAGLRELRLGRNDVGAQGAAALAAVLRRCGESRAAAEGHEEGARQQEGAQEGGEGEERQPLLAKQQQAQAQPQAQPLAQAQAQQRGGPSALQLLDLSDLKYPLPAPALAALASAVAANGRCRLLLAPGQALLPPPPGAPLPPSPPASPGQQQQQRQRQQQLGGPALDAPGSPASAAGSASAASEDLCGVCFDAANHVALRPCRHQLCGQCYREVSSSHASLQAPCPFCRGRIEGFSYLQWPPA
jgi:hypothetical protein